MWGLMKYMAHSNLEFNISRWSSNISLLNAPQLIWNQDDLAHQSNWKSNAEIRAVFLVHHIQQLRPAGQDTISSFSLMIYNFRILLHPFRRKKNGLGFNHDESFRIAQVWYLVKGDKRPCE